MDSKLKFSLGFMKLLKISLYASTILSFSSCQAGREIKNLRSAAQSREVQFSTKFELGRDKRFGLQLQDPIAISKIKLFVTGGNFTSTDLTPSLDNGNGIIQLSVNAPLNTPMTAVIKEVEFTVGSSTFIATAAATMEENWTQNSRIGFAGTKNFIAVVDSQLSVIQNASLGTFKVHFLETNVDSIVATVPAPIPSGAINVTAVQKPAITVTGASVSGGMLTIDAKCTDARYDGEGFNPENIRCSDAYLFGTQQFPGDILFTVADKDFLALSDSQSYVKCMQEREADLWFDTAVVVSNGNPCVDSNRTYKVTTVGALEGAELNFKVEISGTSANDESVHLIWSRASKSDSIVESGLQIVRVTIPIQ